MTPNISGLGELNELKFFGDIFAKNVCLKIYIFWQGASRARTERPKKIFFKNKFSFLVKAKTLLIAEIGAGHLNTGHILFCNSKGSIIQMHGVDRLVSMKYWRLNDNIFYD